MSGVSDSYPICKLERYEPGKQRRRASQILNSDCKGGERAALVFQEGELRGIVGSSRSPKLQLMFGPEAGEAPCLKFLHAT